MRRWRGLLVRRGRFYTGAASSPVPPIPPPQAIRQAGSRPRFAARLLPSSRRKLEPGWGQANQGQPWPSYIRPAGSLRAGARLLPSRRRRMDPPWFPPPPIPPPQFLRPAGSLRFAARLLPSRRRRFDPAWPQANQGQAWACFARQAPHSPPARAPRGHLFPVAPAAPPAAVPGFIRTRTARTVRMRHGVLFSVPPAATVRVRSGLLIAGYV